MTLPSNLKYLSLSEALFASFSMVSLFVGSLYLLGNRNLVRYHWNRDHPQVIVDRLRAISLVTILLPFCLWIFFIHHHILDPQLVSVNK
jgi:hypothetical protein